MPPRRLEPGLPIPASGVRRERRRAVLAPMFRVRPTTFIGALLVLAGCSPPPSATFQGYLEADQVYVAAPLAGTLLERPVNRGDTVRAGQLLFVLEQGAESAAVAESEQRVAQAGARLENLRKGRRPTEMAALEARLTQARAELTLAETELARRERLRRDNVIAPAELDGAQTQRDAHAAAVASLAADLETARLGARDDEVRAAEAEAAAAGAALARARWSLEQKRQAATVGGFVHDTFYDPGEFVPAGAPVLAILPPGNLKARFFLPQAVLPAATPGATVEVHLDGLPAPLRATLVYVATQAEFTPPVIFSRETRQKLVFRAEARFDPTNAVALRPGQPVDVRFAPR